MASTSLRMLRLLSLLQTHRYWPGTELADRLEVSVRTLRRDVDRLRELGYPVHAQRGVDGGYQLAAGAAMPPLVLDDDEAVAIALGLQAAAHSPVAGIAEASVGALAKIVQVMPPRLRRRVDALRTATLSSGWRSGETPPGPVIDPTALTVIAQTCRDTVRLRFDYTAAGGERTEREVEPSRLVALGRRWYLVAYDITRHDWRSFRLDRLERPLATGVRFRPRELPAEDAAAFVRERLSQLPVAFEVVAHVRAPADDVRARIGAWAQVEPVEPQGADAAGTCVVRMSGDQLLWPAMALAATEAEFSVVQPASLRAYLAEAGDRFTRAGADAGGITSPG